MVVVRGEAIESARRRLGGITSLLLSVHAPIRVKLLFESARRARQPDFDPGHVWTVLLDSLPVRLEQEKSGGRRRTPHRGLSLGSLSAVAVRILTN